MFRQQGSPVETAENESSEEEEQNTLSHVEERQERSKRQREVLDDYPVEAFKRQHRSSRYVNANRVTSIRIN
eukprot:11232524-Karenia_brevis.AAC.1